MIIRTWIILSIPYNVFEIQVISVPLDLILPQYFEV